MSSKERPVLTGFFREIADLQKASDLLADVYLEIGPYRDRKLTDETWEKVRNYYKFDDSE